MIVYVWLTVVYSDETGFNYREMCLAVSDYGFDSIKFKGKQKQHF